MNKVIKCSKSECGKYFGYTKEDPKCPFCHTEYGEVKEKPKGLSARARKKGGANPVRSRARAFGASPEDRGATTSNGARTQKKSFKIWG